MATKNPFVQNLKEIENTLLKLERGEAARVMEWTLNSASWQILKKIRKDWPIDSGVSWRLWGFERIKGGSRVKVSFVITNGAPALRGKKAGQGYVPWVYAKGGRPPAPGRAGSPLIARPLVRRAIMDTEKTIAQNYRARLSRYLAKRRKR